MLFTFDTVHHKILLSKLDHYGIRGNALSWFWCYLTDRTQFVSMSGKHSCPLDITCGVPHGCVLGPLFFLYINDLPNVSKHLKFYVFADDTNLYYDSKTLDGVIRKVNNRLKHIKGWLDANKPSLNISKSSFIIFHSSASSIPPCISIKIGKKHISRVKYIKFLKVLLDEHVNGKYHIAELSKKLVKTCGILFRVRYLFSTTTLIILYNNAFFMWFFQHGIVAWGQTFDSYIEPLFKLQKRAVRAISHQSFLGHALPISRHLKLLRIADIFKLQLLSFVYGAINKSAPDCFHGFFSRNSSIHHKTRLSSRGDLFLVKIDTLQYGLKSIRYLEAKLWDELSLTIRLSSSEFIFKKHQKAHFLNAMKLL